MENLPTGGPSGNQTFLWGCAPQESLITLRTTFFQITLWTFHCLNHTAAKEKFCIQETLNPWTCVKNSTHTKRAYMFKNHQDGYLYLILSLLI